MQKQLYEEYEMLKLNIQIRQHKIKVKFSNLDEKYLQKNLHKSVTLKQQKVPNKNFEQNNKYIYIYIKWSESLRS